MPQRPVTERQILDAMEEHSEAWVEQLVSGVKISDTKFSGNHAAICTSSKPDSNLSKNSSISSAGFLQPTLE